MSGVSLISSSASQSIQSERKSCTQPFEQGDAKRRLENLSPWRLKKAKEMMIGCMAQGCSIEQVAQACAISRSHFSRAFKNATGLAPHNWFRQEQILKAQQLLSTQKLSICCVAQECGFSDQSYFTRVFRQFNGVSPRHWQLQQRVHVCGVTDEAIET